MCKPRFPLSVSHTFIYRAKLPDGVILECETFKILYRAVCRNLRTYCRYNETEFKFASVELEYGFYTHYEVRSDYAYEEWTNIRNCGLLGVTTYAEWFCRATDGKYQQFKYRFPF